MVALARCFAGVLDQSQNIVAMMLLGASGFSLP